ncbi:hypothetical protein [Poriferisphaera corsica]|uniref:hypothetical protein n=1 Tax=Poriferisphaera corsica TaxID=2528020 RepID=UPI0011A5F87C|nr:hypothetical protein [Poriferisphaera corsica]
MYIFAGIDEAGYGPLLGPLLVGRSIFAFSNLPTPKQHDLDNLPDIWDILSAAIAPKLVGRKHRITIGDSKKLITKSAGIKHLETALLSFIKLTPHYSKHAPSPPLSDSSSTDFTITLDNLLDLFHNNAHHDLTALPWYTPSDTHPWQQLPIDTTHGEIAIASAMLKRELDKTQTQILDIAATTIFEDHFNHLAQTTRNKASTSFTFVAQHLAHVWHHHGQHHPIITVDRQGGRTRYRHVLQTYFPDTSIRILDESDHRSAYQLTQQNRQMTITFETKGEDKHLPIALASIACKYTRELLMHRLNAFFQTHAPDLKPTKGYTTDGRRFLTDLEPHLSSLNISPAQLTRIL